MCLRASRFTSCSEENVSISPWGSWGLAGALICRTLALLLFGTAALIARLIFLCASSFLRAVMCDFGFLFPVMRFSASMSALSLSRKSSRLAWLDLAAIFISPRMRLRILVAFLRWVVQGSILYFSSIDLHLLLSILEFILFPRIRLITSLQYADAFSSWLC